MFKNIGKWYEKERPNLLFSIGLGLAITIIFTFATASYSNTIQGGIAGEVIRFHILANSNSREDQDLKLKVRDGLLERFEPLLASASGLEQTEALLNSNLCEIEEYSEQIIKENGYNYTACAKIENVFFPTKSYGRISLPAGEYKALRVEIGAAKGNNWWCVVFPPLCFVDVTKNEIDTDTTAEFKNILTDEEYAVVTDYSVNGVKVKFKIVELWQELKGQKIN